MCLILLAWRAHPRFPLVFAGNRDELYSRPSAPAEFWEDAPAVYGGRDLEKHGTWLGITRSGRIAAITNFRDSRFPKATQLTRGELTANFLRGRETPRDYLERIAPSVDRYSGFALLAGDTDGVFCLSNRADGIIALTPGVHGLSNHLLDTPWKKVTRGIARVSALLDAQEPALVRGLFAALDDREQAPDAELPDTGVGLQRERELSPAFIADARYGTRSSTVILVDRDEGVFFSERRFGPLGAPLGQSERRFAAQARAGARVTNEGGQVV